MKGTGKLGEASQAEQGRSFAKGALLTALSIAIGLSSMSCSGKALSAAPTPSPVPTPLTVELPSATPSPSPVPTPITVEVPNAPAGANVSHSIWSSITHHGHAVVETNQLAVYRGKLYAVHSTMGEFWRYDGSKWEKAYTYPGSAGEGGVFVSWPHTIFNDKLVFAGQQYATGPDQWKPFLVIFDGEKWDKVKVSDQREEGMALASLNDVLYMGMLQGRVYSTKDLVNFTL